MKRLRETLPRRRRRLSPAARGRLDIVQGLEGVPSFDELLSRATEAEVLGVDVAVCSVEDLRAMKQAAGRGQDLVDLESLDAAAEG